MSVSTIGQNTANTFSGFEDTTVRDNPGALATNYSTDPDLFVSKYAALDYRTALVKVPGLSNLAVTDIVSDAVIYLKLAAGLMDPCTITLRRILRDADFSTATGLTYDGSNNWTSTMGVDNGTDRSSTVSCAVVVDLVAGYVAFTGAQLIADFQDMVANPSTNEGWDLEITDQADNNVYRLFIGSEGSDGDRPYAEVTHAAAGGSPARHRMTLLGVG